MYLILPWLQINNHVKFFYLGMSQADAAAQYIAAAKEAVAKYGVK